MSHVSLFPAAPLAVLIGEIGGATIAGQRSVVQAGDMSTSQLTVPPGEVLPTAGEPHHMAYDCVLDLFIHFTGTSCWRGFLLPATAVPSISRLQSMID